MPHTDRVFEAEAEKALTRSIIEPTLSSAIQQLTFVAEVFRETGWAEISIARNVDCDIDKEARRRAYQVYSICAAEIDATLENLNEIRNGDGDTFFDDALFGSPLISTTT